LQKTEIPDDGNKNNKKAQDFIPGLPFFHQL
jgi:hypothetical protein